MKRRCGHEYITFDCLDCEGPVLDPTAELVEAIEALLPALPNSWAGCQPINCPCHMHVKRRRLYDAIDAASRTPA